ncbi:MAG: amidohydrolase family protein, partial [Clostridia bacterium]|nr:amidohydrolase family protein [Clostridia bacterium]
DTRVTAARERGVLFDVGDSDYHFDFEVFEKALEQGFAPDLISSDITRVSAFANGLFALPAVIAKCVSLGMNEVDALRAVTLTPARVLGLDTGRIAEGAVADIAVFDIRENYGELYDCKKRRINAKYFPVPMLTLYGGEIAWRSLDFRTDI